MIAAMCGFGYGFDTAEITDAAAAVVGGVAVEDLAPVAAMRHAYAIVFARKRRAVAHHNDLMTGRAALTHEAEHTVRRVVGIDPLEAFVREIGFVQRGVVPIREIEVAHPALQTRVQGKVQKMPVEAGVVIPFAVLADLTAHEQELLARLREHVTEEQAEICEFLP